MHSGLRLAWQLGRACDRACLDDSYAGHWHDDELSTQDCLEVVADLKPLAVRAVTLIDGETFPRDDLLLIAETIVRHEIACSLVTGARGLTPLLAEAMVRIGIHTVRVALNGDAAGQDGVHHLRGAHKATLAAIDQLCAAGVRVAVNTRLHLLTTDVHAHHVPALEIAADGSARVCRALGAWSVGGNVRHQRLREIWQSDAPAPCRA